jgi:transposase-like protein
MIDLISFKGAQYPKPVILYAVYFYVRFPVSYRDLEEIMAERGVDLDHATALLRISADERFSPFPRRIYPTAFVTGVPRAV